VELFAVQIIFPHADQNSIGAASHLSTAAHVVQYGWFLIAIVPCCKDGRDANSIVMDVAALVSACSGIMVIAFLAMEVTVSACWRPHKCGCFCVCNIIVAFVQCKIVLQLASRNGRMYWLLLVEKKQEILVMDTSNG